MPNLVLIPKLGKPDVAILPPAYTVVGISWYMYKVYRVLGWHSRDSDSDDNMTQRPPPLPLLFLQLGPDTMKVDFTTINQLLSPRCCFSAKACKQRQHQTRRVRRWW